MVTRAVTAWSQRGHGEATVGGGPLGAALARAGAQRMGPRTVPLRDGDASHVRQAGAA